MTAASVTSEMTCPSNAGRIAAEVGIGPGGAFDLVAACSGYVYALWLAAALMASGHQRVLLLHGETPTLCASDADRSVSLLFGDAGSATLLEPPNDKDSEPWSFVLRTDGHGFKDLIVEAGGFREDHDLHVRDIRKGVDRQHLPGYNSADHQQKRRHQDKKALVKNKMNQPVQHLRPLIGAAGAHLLA